MKKYPDRVSVVCLFTVNNITVSEHKPTFSVTWVKVRNGVSKVIRFKFLSDTRDQVVLGKDVFTGDSVSIDWCLMPTLAILWREQILFKLDLDSVSI